MAGNTKLRLLYILEILSKYSDEDHLLNSSEIKEILEKEHGVSSDRKTIYECLKNLEEYGYDIVKDDSKKGVFLGTREFELPEVRLMIDAVQSADFISAKKTKAILKKFSKYASVHQYKRIEKQVYIDNRNKSDNESVLYTIDELHNAIINKQQVKIVYRKRKIFDDIKPHYEEKVMVINPYSLIWSDDHYYLVGNHTKYENLIHLRVDRIKSVEITQTRARPVSDFTNSATFDAAEYSNKHLSMFSGDVRPVEFICSNEIVEEFLDEFGEKITPYPFDEKSFSAKVDLAITQGLVS